MTALQNETDKKEDALSPTGRNLQVNKGFVAKSLFSLLVLFALFWHFRNDLPSLNKVDPTSTVIAILLLNLQPALIAVRWWLLTRLYGSQTSLRVLIGITWISVFANQFLPASLGGDVIRIYAVRMRGETLGAAAASVVMDRLFALFALALLVVGFGFARASILDRRLLIAVGSTCVIGIVAAVVTFRLASRTNAWAGKLPLVQKLIVLSHYCLRVFSSPGRGIAVLMLAVLVHVLSLSAFFSIAHGIGIVLDPITFMAIAAILTFVQTVPISISGWGVREAAAVTLFGFVGMSQGDALLASIVLGISYAAASLPGAAIWPFMRIRMMPQKVH